MPLSRALKIYLFCAIALAALAGSWIGLNQLRVRWYLDAVDGRGNASGYFWSVVEIHDGIYWASIIVVVCMLMAAVYDLARVVVSRSQGKLKRHSRRSGKQI